MHSPTDINLILRYGAMSLVGCLIGIAIGGPLGYGCSRLLSAILLRRPKSRQILTLLPWRAFVAGLLLLVLSSLVIEPFIIHDTITATAGIALAALILATPAATSAFLAARHPTLPTARLAAGARTMLTTTAAFTAGVGYFLAEGFSFSTLNLYQVDYASRAYYTTAWQFTLALLLALDLLSGIPHALVNKTPSER